MATYANSSNQIAALKELYKDTSEYMQNLVYKENPWFALVPKDESIDGAAGKYMPVPLEYGTPQGRGHSFATAQANQTPTSLSSFFVYVIQDYAIATIQNLLMEQTKTNAGAFVDGAKLEIDGAMRTLTNNVSFELFGDGTGSRGAISSATNVALVYQITLSNIQQIVNFEVGMTLVNFVITSGTVGSVSTTSGLVQKVNRSTGVIQVLISGTDSSWGTAGNLLGVQGDIISGASTIASQSALCGLGAWIPAVDPAAGENFWGVDRSTDPTRLAGCRYDAASQTIEEGLTNALAFLNREGGRPDIAIMDFASFAALTNSVGAKVQYVQVQHDTADVAFEGIRFQTAYGRVNVLADRNCPPSSCFLLQTDTWKLRSMGKVPHILTYGMEGLEGLRVGNADALEVRMAYYGNLVCSAPGRNCFVKLSA